MSNGNNIKQQEFFIKAKEKSLESLVEGKEENKVIIPVYQRPYSWGENEIHSLLRTIKEGFNGGEEAVFIGTLQINKKKDKMKETTEIIDGQQRLTTFMLLLNYLNYQCELNNCKKVSWIETLVNNGIQQKDLEEYIDLEENYETIGKWEKSEESKGLNTYIKNSKMIAYIFKSMGFFEEEKEEVAGNLNENYTRLINYIKKKLFFIVLETKVGISKSIKIFDTINSTGLDLNGADMFKVRFYEYLSKNNKDENITEKDIFKIINELYEKVEQKNKENIENKGKDLNEEKKWSIGFSYVLEVYKNYLISKYNLPNTLHSHGTDRFFENVFDVLVTNEKVEGYSSLKDEKGNIKLKLEIKDISDIIDVIFEEEAEEDKNYEKMKSIKFIEWSRYPWAAQIRYLLKLSDNYKDESVGEHIKIINLIEKYVFYNSLVFSKVVQHVKKEIYDLYKNILNSEKNKSEIEEGLKNLIKKNYEDSDKYKRYIVEVNGEVFKTRKTRDLMLRFSTINYEYDKLIKNGEEITEKEIKELRKKIFSWKKIDIEHIKPRNSNKNDGKIEEKWDSMLNTIGNLTMLESSINRSISNKSFENKKESNKDNGHSYRTSKYLYVKEHLVNKEKWTVEDVESRKKNEVKKLSEYLSIGCKI